MDYEETIDYLFRKLPMFSRIGAAAYKKDLTNTRILCRFLGNPQSGFKSVHVAGTNGKGSTSHMLAAVFQKAGYKTGLYTSPHLNDFRERIKVNGEMIDKDFVRDFVSRIQPLIEEIEPSFFEITVAMAFNYFAQEKVDIAIVEVGLGGRFDSTNIILPELSVITNISFDHMNILGDTLQKIAYEKAGIIKPGIPVLVGQQQAATDQVFIQSAIENNAPLRFADQKRFVGDWKMTQRNLVVEVTTVHDNDKSYYTLDLTGIYQIRNLVTVLEAIHILRGLGWKISEENIVQSLSHVKKLTGLYGRWEIIREHPLIVLDVAHNEDGIRQLTRQTEITDHEELHIIIGLVKDKEVGKITSLLPIHANYYFTRAMIPRALPEDELAEIASKSGLRGDHYPDVNTALQAAVSVAGRNDLIIICGSVFVVGEVRLDSAFR
jgi:dihydrofolate synthase / folylpolyglutamate synthase